MSPPNDRSGPDAALHAAEPNPTTLSADRTANNDNRNAVGGPGRSARDEFFDRINSYGPVGPGGNGKWTTGGIIPPTRLDPVKEAEVGAAVAEFLHRTYGGAWTPVYGPPESATAAGAPGTATQQADSGPPVYADRVLNRSALRTLADPEPLIGNVIDRGTTALLYGKWGTGKSFIAQDWGLSVGTGRNWQGRAVHRCRVLYVAGEGAFGLKGRVAAWEIGWHTTISDDDFAVLPFPVNLTRPLEVANLAALIAWGGYEFVILDTLARCMVGADENSAKDCGVAIDAMVRLLGCTPDGRGVVLGVHHAGKDGKTLRGSSAFEGAADTVYFTSRDGAVITLDREKRKDGPEADRHQFVIDPIEGTSSAVISVHREGGQTDRGRALLSTFVQHFAQTGASKTELRLVSDMSQGSFYRALSDLLESGELINTGTDKRPFYKGRSE